MEVLRACEGCERNRHVASTQKGKRGADAAAPRAAAKAAVPAVAPEAVDPQESAEALPFGSDRPYGTPVPGGILIGADVPVELKARHIY